MRRREFLAVPVAVGGLMALSSAEIAGSDRRLCARILSLKTLIFDVFGTVVDWRGSIVREGAQWGKKRGTGIDSGEFCRRVACGLRSVNEQSAQGRAAVDQTRRAASHDPRRSC